MSALQRALARIDELEESLRLVAEAHQAVKATIDDEQAWVISCDARDMILDSLEGVCGS